MEVDLKKDLENCNVFAVYGTLMKPFHNHHLMDGATFIAPAQSEFWGTMYSCGGYPILSCVEPSSKIEVELYRIPKTKEGEDTLFYIDGLEGHPHWYERVLKKFSVAGERIEAWIYIQNDTFHNLTEVPSGCWKTHSESRK